MFTGSEDTVDETADLFAAHLIRASAIELVNYMRCQLTFSAALNMHFKISDIVREHLALQSSRRTVVPRGVMDSDFLCLRLLLFMEIAADEQPNLSHYPQNLAS